MQTRRHLKPKPPGASGWSRSQSPSSPLSPASRVPQELLWSREEEILLPARQWLWGNVPTIAVLEKQIALQMSPQILNAYIYLSVVLFQVLRKAEGPQPRSSSHKGLEERRDVFWDFFFFFSLHSICEMKTQIHKATPPTTVTEEGMNWRTIKSGLCLSCHDISSYLPAAAEFSPIFFFSNSWTLSSLVRTGLSCNFFLSFSRNYFFICLIIPRTWLHPVCLYPLNIVPKLRALREARPHQGGLVIECILYRNTVGFFNYIEAFSNL